MEGGDEGMGGKRVTGGGGRGGGGKAVDTCKLVGIL